MKLLPADISATTWKRWFMGVTCEFNRPWLVEPTSLFGFARIYTPPFRLKNLPPIDAPKRRLADEPMP